MNFSFITREISTDFNGIMFYRLFRETQCSKSKLGFETIARFVNFSI